MTDLEITVTGKLGIAPDVADRTWLVPPGQQIHLGFSQAALDPAPDPAVITAVFTPETMAIGLINDELSDVLSESAAWSYAVLAVCAHDASGDVAAGTPSATTVLTAAGELATCAIENVDEVVKQIRNAMPAEEWERISPAISRTANAAKKRLGPIIVWARLSYIAADVGTTLVVDPAALKVNVFHDGLDSPVLTDKDGHPVPNPAADRIRLVYRALKAGNAAVLRRAYAPTSADATPWEQVAPLVADASVRRAMLKPCAPRRGSARTPGTTTPWPATAWGSPRTVFWTT